MIIDLILDRKDGIPYNPKRFYIDVMGYGKIGFGISMAMDGGSEEEVKTELKNYIDLQSYNPKIKKYIDSVSWLSVEESPADYENPDYKTSDLQNYLIDNGIATKEEIDLVAVINGFTSETMNDIYYAKTGEKDLEELVIKN